MLWWWLLLPSVHFVALPIVDYDVLAVPPLRFAAEDVEAFSHLPRRGEAVVLGDLQTSQSIVTLTNRLQGLAVKRRDSLILYLRVYGVSDDGKAWVLCSDYLRTPEGGRCPLADLLGQIAQCPAAKKLLILDAGELAGDPRLGMIVNEFAQLLDEEVRRVNDPGLWVLASNRLLEVSHVSDSAKRSALGHFVSEGLRGTADRDGDGMVELAELVAYVREGVADWVGQDSGGAQSQTPWLLHGGEGAANAPAGLTLLPISDRGREGDGSQEGPAPSEAPGKPDAPNQSADPRNQATKQVAALLEQAWRLRDQIEQPLTAAPATPIDYAPHLWRAYQELLLGYERRFRGGSEYDPAKLADDLRMNILPLASLAAGQPLPPAAGRATIVSRLADAQQRFLVKFKQDWSDQLAKDPRAGRYLELVRLKNEFLFRAIDYVRWLAAAAPSSPRRHRLYQPIADFLGGLRSFVDQLESLEDAASAPSEGNRVEDALASLGLQAENLQRLRKAVEEEGLYKDAADLIDLAAKNPAKKGIAGPIDGLLATPLLPAPLRTRLLRARVGLEQPFAAEERSAASLPQPQPLVRWSGQLDDQAALEGQLVGLADPAVKLPSPESGDVPTAQALVAKYRAFGKAIGQFYQRLPKEINRDFRPGDTASARRCERLLRAVDARDAEQIREDVAAIAVRPVRFPPSAEFHLAIEGPREALSLEPDGRPTTLEIAVTASGRQPGAAQWMLTYNPGELTIDLPGGTTPIAPDKWMDFSLDQEPTRLKYAVIAKASNGRETSLTISVRRGEKSETRRIPIRLPAPDVVDLLVHQIGGVAEQRIQGTDNFRLRPFPNRINSYRFALVNRSGRAKNVLVQWFSVPETPPGRQPSRELVLDASGGPRQGLAPITPPLEMKLPAAEDAVPIRFPEPKPAAVEKGAAKPEGTPAPPPLPTTGLACVIRDSAGGEAKWIKWVDFAARPPKEYVTPQVRYDAREGKIHIDVRATAAEGLPPLSPETPIAIAWNTEGELGPDVAVKSEALITAPDQTAALYADVSPGADKKVLVRLAVDGYPRAFVYEVKCDRDRPEIRPDRDRRSVHFTAPLPDQAFRVPLAAPIPVELQVDAPEDAFRAPGDAVEVRIIAEDSNRELCPEQRRQFFNDRQTAIYLGQLTAQGEMKIQTRVGDFKISMAAAGLKNTKVRIAAELLLADRAAVRDSVRVALDAAPPVFEIRVPGRPVPRGQNVMVWASVTDELSGIEKMEFGFDLQNNDEFDKKIEPLVVRQPSEDGTWRAALPTKDLEPGQYRILVRATDRVGYAAKQRKLVTIGPAPDEAPPAAKTSTVNGRVALQDGRSLPGIRVTLRETGLAAVTDAEGRFTFTDVPHGKYHIDAKGTGLGRELAGSKEIVLPAPVEPATVEVRLEW
jgi:hypothetical protein